MSDQSNLGTPMKLRTVVIMATKDRPNAVSNLLDTLAQQTVLPDTVVVSACEPSDVKQRNFGALNVQLVFGSPGLTAQRNRALSLIQGKCDVVVFFDDDFIPSRFWIERLQMFFAMQPEVGCVTGRVLFDGVKAAGELEWSDGKSMVDAADSAEKRVSIHDCRIKDKSPYGCNMAFRSKIVEHLKFDERLVLYGWLEDLDFGFRAGTAARTILTDCVWGVHLGTKRGRTSGVRYGYSQAVNPWYLMKKGTVKPFDACRYIARGLVRNALGSIFQNSSVDRRGRLRGNIVGVKDIIVGRWAPERIVEL